jgi:hypothetical protein
MPKFRRFFSNPVAAVKETVSSAGNLIDKTVGSVSNTLAQAEDTAKSFIASDVGMIALAVALPGAGAALGSQIFAAQIAAGAMTAATASAIGTAIVSTAIQTSQGVPFETALQNATVSAVVSTQSPTIANDIAKTVGSPGVADAITSAGASIVSTMAKGGSTEDALKNAGAAIVASGVSGETDRTVGAAVGGAITGGATGAAIGAAGEIGRPSTTTRGTQVASAGDINQEPGVVSDSPPPNVEISSPRETTIGDTNIQIPTTLPTAPPTAPSVPEVVVTAPRAPTDIAPTDVQVIDAIRNENAAPPVLPVAPPAPVNEQPEVVVTAPREPTGITDTNIQVADTVPTTPPAVEKPEMVITAPREPANIEDTDIQSVDVVGQREDGEVISEGGVPEEDTKEPSIYKPNLFIYSGKSPRARGNKALSQALGTDFAGGTPTSTTGLTSYRGAGEIEGEGGTNRKNVWNEESLRLKDALGL